MLLFYHILVHYLLLSHTVEKNMKLISPGIYSIGKVKSCSLLKEESDALQRVKALSKELVEFEKLLRETILMCSSCSDKRNSSVCSFFENKENNYGLLQKLIFTPALALLRSFKKTSSTLLQSVGNPCRSKLMKYATADMLSEFVMRVENELQPTIAIPISHLIGKCTRITIDDKFYSFLVSIPNNYEYH